MLLRLFMCLIIYGTLAVRSALPDLKQDTEAKLHSKSSTYSLRAGDFAHALILVANNFKIPMGIEWVRSARTLKEVDLSWRDASVEQMISTIVNSQPCYRVEVSDGIVHVFPTSEQLSRQNFLNLNIRRFEARNEVIEVASRRLRDSVRPQVSAARLESQGRVGFASSQATNIGDPKFTLSLENMSVRRILDRFIAASDRKIWIVTFASDNRPTAGGYWPTATLWTNVSVPDSEQPVWDFLRWNDSVP